MRWPSGWSVRGTLVADADGGVQRWPVPTRLATEVVGRRGIQFVIDTALQVALTVGLGTVWMMLYLPREVWVLFYFGWGFAIFVLVPWRCRGRTPGMMIMSISVVRRGGGPAGFAQLLARWLILLVEAPFLFGPLGLIVLMFSRDNTRFGDKAADTWVVWSPDGQPAWITAPAPAPAPDPDPAPTHRPGPPGGSPSPR